MNWKNICLSFPNCHRSRTFKNCFQDRSSNKMSLMRIFKYYFFNFYKKNSCLYVELLSWMVYKRVQGVIHYTRNNFYLFLGRDSFLPAPPALATLPVHQISKEKSLIISNGYRLANGNFNFVFYQEDCLHFLSTNSDN